MDRSNNTSGKPQRRNSDLTLLGSSSQEMEDRVYTLTFGVDLADTSFEGLHNYAVSISRLDTDTGMEEALASVLRIGLQSKTYSVSVEGGPFYDFDITKKTVDLTSHELDQGVIDAVHNGIAWVKGEVPNEQGLRNRRHVPIILLDDPIAVSLLMSSISTLIGGATKGHHQVINEKGVAFDSREDYINHMYDVLKGNLDTFTEVAIYRCVNYYMSNT